MINYFHIPDPIAQKRILVFVRAEVDGVKWELHNSIREGKDADRAADNEAPLLFAKLIRRLKAMN